MSLIGGPLLATTIPLVGVAAFYTGKAAFAVSDYLLQSLETKTKAGFAISDFLLQSPETKTTTESESVESEEDSKLKMPRTSLLEGQKNK